MRRRTWKSLVLVWVCLGLGSGSAWGYVREVTTTGVPIAWSRPCVDIHLRLDTPPPLLTSAEVFAATTQALAAWSYPQVACTDIRLDLVTETEDSTAGYDNKNVIVFRQDNWCRESALPDDDPGIPSCYPSSALAVTSVFKNKKTGEILDADIEFNAVHYTWGDLVVQPALAASDTADFQNALTHELGHLIGLDHNCHTGSDGATRPNDHTGTPAVNCFGSSDPPASIAEATMYPSVVLSDTTRRTLTADDELGVCEIYPHAHEICPPPPSDGGCRLAPGPASPRRAWPEVLAGLFVLLLTAGVWRHGPRRRDSARKDEGEAPGARRACGDPKDAAAPPRPARPGGLGPEGNAG